jgi:all-trans-retinol 13,14-reductase
MAQDVIVVGGGIGGLYAAAKLVRAGRKVLVLEKNPHVGGTSYIFHRGPYYFPMGPLSFSYPARVKALLEETGLDHGLGFRRSHFQLVSPSLDIVYSRSLDDLEAALRSEFPSEAEGLGRVFLELKESVRVARDLDLWHPDYSTAAGAPGFARGSTSAAKARSLMGSGPDRGFGSRPGDTADRLDKIRIWSGRSASDFLGSRISTPSLRNLIGSMGTEPPQMSFLNLTFMWAAMSEVGIWSPSCGIHGICRMLASAVSFGGGDVKLSSPVGRILIENGRAVGILTAHGEEHRAESIVVNTDYKKAFLELIDPVHVRPEFLDLIRTVPYTGSEICVYLGINPDRVDLRRMKAEHLFFRKEIKAGSNPDPEDFGDREIEVCLWSAHAPDSVPRGKAALVLRVGFPYDRLAPWRTGEKKRRQGYRETKNRLAWKIIGTVEAVLPGLTGAVEIMETATPLTYRDWGQRTLGSVAGWTWSSEADRLLPGKLLIQTPIRNLFMAGAYAATELFLGGVPTALYTASLAADLILAART